MDSTSSLHISTEDIDAFELSYQSGVSLDRSGRIVSKEKKSALREQLGYCLTCPGVPVQLYEIRKSRLNPLWSSKKPRTVEGQCAKGRCLRCNPEHKSKQDNLSRNPSDTSTASTHSSDSQPQSHYNHRQQRRPSIDSTTSLDRPQSHYNHRQQRRTSLDSTTSMDRNSSHGGSLQIPPTTTNVNSSSSHSRSSLMGEAERARRATVSSSMIRGNTRRSFGSYGDRSQMSGGGNDYLRSNSNHGNSSWDQDSDSRSMSAVDEARRRRDQLQTRIHSSRRLESNRADSTRSFCDSSISSVGSHHMDDRSARSSSSGGTPRSRHSVSMSLSSRSLNTMRPSSFPSPPMTLSRNRSGGSSTSACLRGQFLSKKHSESCRSLDSVDEEVPENELACPSMPTSTTTLETLQDGKSHSSQATLQHQQREEQDNSPEIVLGNLQALLNDMQQMGSAELMSEVLINSMDSHPKLEEIQLLCIRTVSQVFQQLDTMPFVASNGHKRILFAMKTFPSSLKIQSEGCEALAVLSVRDDTRLILARAGSCIFVDKALMQFLGDASLAASALKILRSLSFEQEGSRALEKLNMSTKLVEIMYCNLSSAEIQRDGCALLSNLAVDVEKQRVSAVDKNILAVVIAGILEHEQDASVVASACFALKNLTHEESNLRALSRVESVLDAIYAATKLEEAIEDASIVMERIQMSMAQDQSLEEHAHQTLKEMMERRSKQPEVVEELVGLFKNYNWSEQVASECAKTLHSLVTESEPHWSQLAKGDNAQRLKTSIQGSNLEQATQDVINRLIELANEQQNQETAATETHTTTIAPE